MTPVNWAFSSYMLVYGLAWLIIVGAIIVALWRGALAQERIARHLEGIERAMTERPMT
jgi:Tfp pilus assembly protein PilX